MWAEAFEILKAPLRVNRHNFSKRTVSRKLVLRKQDFGEYKSIGVKSKQCLIFAALSRDCVLKISIF